MLGGEFLHSITALVACGIGRLVMKPLLVGDFFASCAAIVAAKAIPVIAEVDELLTIDLERGRAKNHPGDESHPASAYAGCAVRYGWIDFGE